MEPKQFLKCAFKEAENLVSECEIKYQLTGNETDLINSNKQKSFLTRSEFEINAFWKQKANFKWLKEGDANTSFFHKSVKEKRVNSKINKIKSEEGNWLVTDTEIKEEGIQFF